MKTPVLAGSVPFCTKKFGKELLSLRYLSVNVYLKLACSSYISCFKVSLNNQWRIVLDLLAKNGALEGVSYRDQCRIISRRSQVGCYFIYICALTTSPIFESPFDNQVHWFRLDWSRYVDMDADSLLLMPDSGEFLHVYQLSTMTLIYVSKGVYKYFFTRLHIN